ncbi:MAG: DUF4168 domain-containing protein [Scytolyngbya sp. HA4215-MV1]|jgi:DNA-binding transcriptional MerR regulator|nr:DUF4168 domain-containing protein [Scytolyngbya sp. HA4215-MV1]
MIKFILVSGFILISTFFSPAIVQAQTPVATPPTAQPAPPQITPFPSTPKTEISPEELRKFSRITKQILVMTEAVKTQIIQTIQKAGFTEQQFDEIYQAQSDSTVQPAKPLSAQEKTRYDQAIAQIHQIQQAAQTQIATLLKSESMDLQRFNQILAIVQNDPKLLQEVQRLMKSESPS